MEYVTAKRNAQAPLRLLSLDGGGVRGLSSLMVLDDLMESVAREEKRLGRRALSDHSPLKPCDYFDLIGGTSTGGIIAILLSRLRLDCKQCIAIYTKLAEQIFKKDRSVQVFGVKVPTGATRFSGTVLADAIKNALKELGYDPNELMWDEDLFEESPEMNDLPRDNIWADAAPELMVTESPASSMLKTVEGTLPSGPATTSTSTAHDMSISQTTSTLINDASVEIKPPARTDTWKIHPRQSVHRKADVNGCRGFVLTSLKNALGLPRILSTYDPNDRTTRIWEALRATSAAPTFFEEMQFGTPKVTYLDGGVGFNNPCAEVDYAAKALWEGRPIGVIVSVGTGLQSLQSVQKMASWLPFNLGTDLSLASALAGMATSTARVDNEMKRMYNNTSTKYYRFDVDRGLANVSLEQWMKEDEMASLTEQYMHDGRTLRSAQDFGQIMAKLSALPPHFSIAATHFRAGMRGCALLDQSFSLAQVDFKTGLPLGVSAHLSDVHRMPQFRSSSPSGEGGLTIDDAGRLRRVFPVSADLDHDGRREEAAVYQCLAARDICLRAVKTGIPPGEYRVQCILAFHASSPPNVPPHDLVFSVGKPFDPATFAQRVIDVRVSPDVVPVLLHPDAVRVRVGKKRYERVKGTGWVELEGDIPVRVGLDGALGFVLSRRWAKGEVVDGWSFGGVRLEPVFEGVAPLGSPREGF